MKIILKEKIENLGSLGKIVYVKNGFARNWLFPYGKAVQANKKNIEEFKKHEYQLKKAEEERQNIAKEKAIQLSNQTFTIKVQAGEGGKLFGSVSRKDIIQVIQSQTDIQLEKRNIRILKEPIRYIGEVQVSIQLYTGIDANIKLIIVEK